jgi:hypothetical protein
VRERARDAGREHLERPHRRGPWRRGRGRKGKGYTLEKLTKQLLFFWSKALMRCSKLLLSRATTHSVGIRPSPHDDYAPRCTPRDNPPTRRPPHATQRNDSRSSATEGPQSSVCSLLSSKSRTCNVLDIAPFRLSSCSLSREITVLTYIFGC